MPDCGRKRQQVNPKDNFWPATARTKPQIEAWFKDLAGMRNVLNIQIDLRKWLKYCTYFQPINLIGT